MSDHEHEAIREALDLMATCTDHELGEGGIARKAYGLLHTAYFTIPKKSSDEYRVAELEAARQGQAAAMKLAEDRRKEAQVAKQEANDYRKTVEAQDVVMNDMGDKLLLLIIALPIVAVVMFILGGIAF